MLKAFAFIFILKLFCKPDLKRDCGLPLPNRSPSRHGRQGPHGASSAHGCPRTGCSPSRARGQQGHGDPHGHGDPRSRRPLPGRPWVSPLSEGFDVTGLSVCYFLII